MSQGCALLILRSKGQRSKSWRMVIWKWFPDDNWLCNQPMIMKLHTLTPHEFVGVGGGPVLLQQYFQYAFICCPYMLPLLFENGFRTITDSVINLWSWNFIHLLTMSQGCALSILRSKGQGHGAWLFENGFRTITDSVINQWSWNFIHLLTMSQGCALLILRSKGQRSRSWRMVIWKWFPDNNWLCNQPMIMNFHTLTHHESRMRPIDFEVKRSKVKVMAHGYLKMVSGR